MEEFVKDYVEMIVDIRGVELNKTQLQEIVNRTYNQESIWDELDYFINSQIDKFEKEGD